MSLKEHFKGKRVLVTGAARGIGRAFCLRLHEYGATIFALSQSEDTLAKLAAEIPGIKTIQVDIGDWDATRAKISELPPLDFLINNAGVSGFGTFMKIQPDDLDRVLSVNLKALVNISQVVAEKMIENGIHGSIINISSNLSQANLSMASAYSTTKAAVDKMTQLMAIELGVHKIRVNSINPGPVDTDMLRASIKNVQIAEGAGAEVKSPGPPSHYTERVPLKVPFVDMDALVNTTLFILSNMASMVTGQSIFVDAGFTIT